MSQEEKEQDDSIKADWKDYIAIGIAMLETVLLPIVIVVAFMIVLVAVLAIR
ncbi:MAG: hypothetical protein OK456_10115 [Thaumarchaeota archaeon]|nr:hypothetical protein [Nitrososphaerota archaeon]